MATQNPYQHSYPEIHSGDHSGQATSALGQGARKAGLAMDDCDWDALFDAVAQRLKDSVAELPTDLPIELNAVSPLPPLFARESVKAQVLDCVGALVTLHAALRVKRALANEEAQLQLDPPCSQLRQYTAMQASPSE